MRRLERQPQTPYFHFLMTTLWFRNILLIFLVGIVGTPTPADARHGRRPRPPAPVAQKERQPPLTSEELLTRSRFAGADVGYLLFDIHDGSVVEAHPPDEPRVPASTLKAVTMIAALQVLGADYRFATSLFTTGAVIDSILHGDLYL